MKTYLAIVFLSVAMPPVLLFTASEISYQRCGKRVRYPLVASLWFACFLAYAYVGYVQLSLGCRAIIGECYLDGITFSFLFWKDVLGFSYLGVILLSSLHLIYQVVRWVLSYAWGLAHQGGESG